MAVALLHVYPEAVYLHAVAIHTHPGTRTPDASNNCFVTLAANCSWPVSTALLYFSRSRLLYTRRILDTTS
jgi:hypothetical protein